MYKAIIIDDSPWSVANIKCIFPWEHYGFEEPITTDNPQLALSLLLQHKPDVLFTDIKMPQISGFDLIKQLSVNNLKTKIVLISAYTDFAYAQQAISYGVFRYLSKPISRQEAEKVIHDLKNALDKEYGKNKTFSADYISIKNPSFKKLIEYIDENYTQKLQLEELSALFQINPSYCSHLFSEHFNCGFTTYITNLKLKKAAELLVENNMWINEIADFLNYDYNYFNKLFKKHYGVTPKQFQQRGEKNES
ncbi:MAG: response regulator [Clostridia bacterium]|nr:response regulator [Clostridia bacterium]